MASPFQQQALQRKLIYLGLVVALFTGSWVWRRYVVETKAQSLGLLEQTHGDVSAADRTVELLLTGSRGLLTTALWWTAMEQQKKNQWNDLELTVRSLTRLQPHFITPWQFQSWNLAYNVSVESDRIRDKYFYIARGIQLLAVGERQNRYNPELRRDLGFYHQHKICASDENNTMRSLFQLSCIAPVERDPEALRNADGSVNWEKFEVFCKAHPQLVRRLYAPPLPYDLRREYPKFRCGSAAEVIQFLEDNKDVPSLFVEKADDAKGWEQGKRKPDELERFPILPPEHANAFDRDEWTQEKLARGAGPEPLDAFDGYVVARAWYGYSLEPLPPPGDLPGETEPIQDRLRQRMPRHMSTIIFRSSAPLAQNFVAVRLQEEGWFDAEPFALTNWFKSAPGGRAVEVGGGGDWAAESWGKARKMWEEHGRRNHLWFEDPARQKNMEKDAKAFAEKFAGGPGQMPPRLDATKLTKREKEQFFAARFMQAYHAARTLTNFPHFLTRAGAEAQPMTATARKLVYQAEQLRLVDLAYLQALAKYEDPRALAGWRKVLEKYADFRNDPFIQEETFEMELKYERLYRKLHGTRLARDLVLESFLGQALAQPPLGASWSLLALYDRKPPLLPELDVRGTLYSLVPEDIKNQVLIRRELKKPSQTQMQPGQRPPEMPPGMSPDRRPMRPPTGR